MANTVTLSDLRDQARQRGDFVNSNFITDTELDNYINEALLELYDMLTMHYGDDYFQTVTTFNIGSTATLYPLPGDFYKLKGVEVAENSSTVPGRYITVLPFMIPERNRYAYNSSALPSRPVRLRYVPVSKRLIDTSTTTQTFTSTDVDTTNDTITVVDHGYSTNDIITLSTTTTLPAPLAVSTNYYIIHAGDDTFKLATTLQNAFDNVAIDLTDGGTGTHTINGNRNSFDFINGYESYVIWRAVEMMKEKEESDTQVATSNVQRAMDRVVRASSNRDAAHPQRVFDIETINDTELRVYSENNIRYRVMGRNIEFIYVGYLGV